MAERPVTFTRRCAVNPLIGREIEGMEVVPARKSKKVMVVGGGVAGLKAAVTAAQRGHKVILCEKADKVGGILKSEEAISFKHEMYELGVVLERQAKDEGVEIRLNTTVTPEYVEKEGVDALILAVGSTPIVPPIPGIDSDNVIIVNDYYLNKDKVGDSVVVLGGGLAGCECAIHLGMEGKKVELVEMRDTLAADCNIRQRPILMRKVAEFSTAHTEYVGQKITAEGVICKDKEGNEVLVPGKTVICALGQRSNRADVDALRGCAPFVREVGDCVRPANITKAIYEAYHAALDI
jgi:NADPH-dependent 2,4-dienoyl-CoA reductase/sulfur reductase-like enzyme